MSTQPTADLGGSPVDERTVAEYLRTHPDFFVAHADLLSELVIPHASGQAVSLVEKQVAALRDQNQHLRHQLQTLIHNARGNETLSERMHALTLSLLGCDRPEHLFSTLCDRLREDFDADAVAICLTDDVAGWTSPAAPREGLQVRRVARDELQPFDNLLKDQQAVCGRLTQRQVGYLFGDQAGAITSVALTPLRRPGGGEEEAMLGMMGIGSRDTQRFQSGMGTVFLRQLADIVMARLLPPRG